MRAALLLVLCALELTMAAPARARELYWRALAVRAHLDADGRLHVHERQDMVFTGDWNGGERTFRLSGEHELTLESLARVDAIKGEVPLIEGDLDETDHYAWADGSDRILRWRSRQPSDPPFDETLITYVLRYRLENILVDAGDGAYLLDHDFAFTERDGTIERFTLELELDPAWQTDGSSSRRLELGPLAPGAGAVLRLPLTHVGAGAPGAVLHAAPPAVGYVLALALVALVWWVLRHLLRRERALGRFDPVPNPDLIDGAWLTEHVLSMKPEVVGAAYDRKTGAAEVAAVLARMVLEKKIESRVTHLRRGRREIEDLELTLLVDRDQLEGYERALVNGLFFSGDHTSTDAIRKHYEKRGFDPAARIEGPVKEAAESQLGESEDTNVSLAALGAGASSVLLGVLAGYLRPSELAELVPRLFGIVFWIVVACIFARRWSQDMAASPRGALTFIAPAGLGVWGVWNELLSFELSFWGSAALASFGALSVLIVVVVARSADGPRGVALRKRLAAAREYFARELSKPEPRIADDWFPYLMALDLGRNVDRWFRAFGGTNEQGSEVGFRSSTSSSSSGGISSSSTGSGWTGGGGAFGGAGAAGSWAAATTAMAAGVASASSSSGGSSGGSSSSGGGGGGGW